MTVTPNTPPRDCERHLAEVFDELTAAGTADASMRIAADAASELADVDGVCLLSRDGERCVVALAHQQPIYLCDLRSSGFHRASMPWLRTETKSSRMFWGKEDFIALPNGERRRIGVTLIVPVRATSGYAASAFFWQPGRSAQPQHTRRIELLAKALGLAACTWRESKEHAAQHRVSADLQHRLRNNLALMRSVVRRSHETAETAEHFALHLEARLGALARMQGMMAAVGDTGVEIEDLIRIELAASAVPAQRYALQGPAVRLHAKGAESMALAMHELATNSLKFGALGASNGRLEVIWSVSTDSLPRLLINWVESGVTIVSAAPRRRGFGQELIECTLPYELGAHTRLVFTPGGVLCAIEVPLEACATSVEPAAQHTAQGGWR